MGKGMQGMEGEERVGGMEGEERVGERWREGEERVREGGMEGRKGKGGEGWRERK